MNKARKNNATESDQKLTNSKNNHYKANKERASFAHAMEDQEEEFSPAMNGKGI